MEKTMLDRENISHEIIANVIPEEFTLRVDASRLRLSLPHREWFLEPTHIGEGLPADVRRWMAFGIDVGADAIPVVTARHISRGARAMLDEQKVSWADSAGSAVIQDSAGLYVARLSPSRRLKERPLVWNSVTADTAEAALELRRQVQGSHATRETSNDLVTRPASIAEVTGYSYAQTARALSSLDGGGYTVKIGAERGTSARRQFADPGRLLSDWAGHHSRATPSGPSVQYHVPWRNSNESIDLLSRLLPMEWVTSGLAGADRLAPYVNQIPDLLVYVRAEDMRGARQILLAQDDFSEVETGGRITLASSTPHILTLATSSSGIRIAPAVRIYGDLLRLQGRGAEAGEFLRESIIGF